MKTTISMTYSEPASLMTFTTRPAETRSEREMKVYDLLEELSISYIRVDHQAMYTIDDCRGVDQLLGIDICKNLFLCNAQKTRFYLLMMPGYKKFVTRDFCRQIQSPRLSFAPQEYMEAYLGLTPGSVSILGLMNDHDHHVQLVMDREVADKPFLGCHPCVNTSSLALPTRDILDKFLPHTGHDVIYVNL